MRKYKVFSAVALLLLTTCKTNADVSPVWREDGLVTSADGKQQQLDIMGIYDALNYEGSIYLAGFKIDKEGTNNPHIAKISSDISAINYWSFEKIPNDIFIYQEKVHAITTDGQIYTLQDEKWNPIDKKFPRESQVVYSDYKSDLVVCYPAAMEKTGDPNSGCISTRHNWKLDFIWFTTVPKACNDKLHIVEENGESKVAKHIDLTTGKILKSEPVKNLPEDICKL